MTAVKASRNRQTLPDRLRRTGRAMRDDHGGYAMITVIIICAIVIGAFVTATLLIVQQSYQAQERQFARQTELLQAQGNLEATRAELEAWASDANPVELSEFTKENISGKLVDTLLIEDPTLSLDSPTTEEKANETAERPIDIRVKASVGNANIETTIRLKLTCKVEGDNFTQITSIETSYTSYEEALG